MQPLFSTGADMTGIRKKRMAKEARFKEELARLPEIEKEKLVKSIRRINRNPILTDIFYKWVESK
jgi:5,10-methylene-tetrahydrofolate dehydrogenase/methenyl tetrahydrofolate cyclohydrolase